MRVYCICILGPAPESVTSAMYEESGKIAEYRICRDVCPNFSKPGKDKFKMESGNFFHIEVVDSVSAYCHMMKEIFDFVKLKKFVSGVDGKDGFPIVVDAMNGGELKGVSLVEVLCFFEVKK